MLIRLRNHDPAQVPLVICLRRAFIVDIGGGNGRLIATLLRADPGAQGILLDRPDIKPQPKCSVRLALWTAVT